jgi:hypothetical protein
LLNRKLEQLEQKKIDLETIRKKNNKKWVNYYGSIGVVHRKESKRSYSLRIQLKNVWRQKQKLRESLENTILLKFQP